LGPALFFWQAWQFAASIIAAAMLFGPQAAFAGPPFMTDDPEPTETGHWEIYAPQFEIEGRGDEYEGAAGMEINYGAAHDLQLTVGVPMDIHHDDSGTRSGFGDLKVSAKYRFYHNADAGVQIAFFPGMTLPTGGHEFTAGRVTALLPVWLQKDSGAWSIFGGGGYAINPGQGNRNYWTGGVAVARQVTPKLLMALEVKRSGADTVDGHASTSLGIGAILQLPKPFRLLASGGPTFEDSVGGAGYHGFVALGLDF
jgi:Putative MetA-pathway of phenol degradation